MNALSKLIMFFAVLGILGAGLFFFPQSPLHISKLVLITQQQAPAASVDTTVQEEEMGAEEMEESISDDQVVEDVEMEMDVNQ